MLSEDDMLGILSRISYRPGLAFSLRRHKDRTTKAWKDYLQVGWEVHNAFNPGTESFSFVMLTAALDGLPTTNEKLFCLFVRRCIQNLELHELDEFLKIDGKYFQNPHPGHPATEKIGVYDLRS